MGLPDFLLIVGVFADVIVCEDGYWSQEGKNGMVMAPLGAVDDLLDGARGYGNYMVLRDT